MTPPDAQMRRLGSCCLGRRAALIAGVRALSLAAGARAFAARPAVAQAGGSAYPPDLIAAARKEGQVTLSTSEDPALLTQQARAFQASFPGIALSVARVDTAAQMAAIAEAAASGRHDVDVLTSNDLAAMVDLRRNGRLDLFVPDEVRRWPVTARDPDGFYSFTALGLMVLGYNTHQVMPEQAPKSYADLLAVRFANRLVAAHPGYSGDGLTTTFLLAAALGWTYFEQLSRQGVLQVQTVAEAVGKVAAGERSVMLYGSEQAALRQKAAGAPIGLIYPEDGTAGVPSATAVLRDAPHPNAARLLATWMVGKEAQDLVVASGARSFHPDAREPSTRPALSTIKLLSPDPILLAAEADLVKQLYTQLFPK